LCGPSEWTEKLPALLEKGLEHFGFRGAGLENESERSSRRNSEPKYDVPQVGRITGRIGWSRQKLDHRSDKRDEEAIEEWPQIKKAETEDM